jgi:hypothetical protein
VLQSNWTSVDYKSEVLLPDPACSGSPLLSCVDSDRGQFPSYSELTEELLHLKLILSRVFVTSSPRIFSVSPNVI